MEDNQIDLFEQYETLPNEVRAIIDTIDKSYHSLLEAERTMNKIGYSFEWGIDGIPYNLRKL